jgi:hypothetical protein
MRVSKDVVERFLRRDGFALAAALACPAGCSPAGVASLETIRRVIAWRVSLRGSDGVSGRVSVAGLVFLRPLI